MMKFSALNESSLSDDNGDPELATREAQEEEAYSLYHSALKKQSEGKGDESEKLLKEILEMEFLTQTQPSEENDEVPLRPALTLKYLLYKNLANISNSKQDYQSAVTYFLEALEIDSTDVVMWYQMGKAALNITNYSLARLCFEEGLKCNPNHWPCLDNVITVMYTLNDYANCLFYIAKALERECYYLKGLAFKNEIYREDPSLKSFCENYFKKCDASIYYCEYDKEEAKKLIQESLDMRMKKQSFYKPTPLPILTLSRPIKENTWKNLGESLINMYDCIINADPGVSFSCKIDLSPYLEASNKIIDLNTEKLVSPSLSSLSEACSSNSTSHQVDPATQALQKPSGLLQLATLPPDASRNGRNALTDPAPLEMDIDETPSICNTTASPYSLVLPQVETQVTDLSVCNDSTSSNRTSKRKRLLSELNEFSAKRRSSRVRNPAIKKPLDNINYQELLQKFLPSKLIGDGAKCEDNDCDSEPVSLDKISGELSCGQSSENEKSDKSINSNDLSCSEKEDVSQYISRNQSNSGIIDLLYKYVVILGKKSCFIWPKNLIDVFCLAFTRLRKHITTPNLFSQNVDHAHIKEIGLAILAFCEFKVDKWYLSTGHSMSFSPKTSTTPSAFQNGTDSIGNDFHADMEFLVMSTVRRDALDKDWLDFSARALWLKAKFHSLEGEIDLAVQCMGKLSNILSDENEVKITVQNCSFSNIITTDKVQQQLESLQRCQSLEEVQRLYEHGDYAAVVDLLILTFNQPRTKRKQPLDGVPERHAQLLLLQNSLWKLERYRDCVFWSEVSFNEALQQFMNAARSDWSETMAHLLSSLDSCTKLNSKYLSDLDDSKLVRLTQNLILVIVIQMENYDFSGDNAALLVVLPWIILYRLILNEEKRGKSKKSSKAAAFENGSAGNSSNKMGGSSFLSDFDLSSSMPSSLMLLFTAHEYLGRRSWCTAADGLLLLYFIDVMMTELQDSTGNSYLYREDLETGLEQCIYCLYGHPNKRTRAKHLQEHSAKQLPLTWEKAMLIFQYFKPNVLPEFDSYRTSTVSAELESLLKRISALVPPEEDPTTRVDNYTAYIEGVTEKCPEPPFQGKIPSLIVKDLYYLLGDYYFKNKEFSKAIRFYLMDICVNPDRQDSWAGMALSRSSQLDQKLNSYELRNESTIYRKSSAALKCFEHALELDPTTTSLWIEHGSLAYILHSHASRQLKQDAVCEELYELLKKKKLEMLQVAEKCFRAANHCDDGGEPEEAWLHHYMLGKICEKKEESPVVYLDHFQKALMYLHEDFARYPQKIQYHNPLELSIEALEVYYRVHASCLKFLWKHEVQGVDLATLKVIKKCLKAIGMSPFANFIEKCKKEISCSSSAHSEAEDYATNTPVTECLMIVDHNYFDDAEKTPQALNNFSEKRQGRPSIDSSPETLDSTAVQEVMDSLVAVVAERFIDEAIEKADSQTCVPSNSKKNYYTKVIIETVVEESVYTTKLSDPVEVQEISTVNQKTSIPFETTPKIEDAEVKAQLSGSEFEKAMDSYESSAMCEEKDEFTKLQDLAMELETEAAASYLVEEMMMDTDRETDYCDYNIYTPKQEEPSSLYYECMNYSEDDEKSLQYTEANEEVSMVISWLLDKVEEKELQESEAAVQQNEISQSGNYSETYMNESINISPFSENKDESGDLMIDENDELYLELAIPDENMEDNAVSSSNRGDEIPMSESKSICDSTEPSIKVEPACDGKPDLKAPTFEHKDNLPVISTDPIPVAETVIKDPEECIGQSLTIENLQSENPAIESDTVIEKELETSDTKCVPCAGQEGTGKIQGKENKTDSQDLEDTDKLLETDKKDVENVQSSQNVPIILPPTPEELELSKAEISALTTVCLDAMRECLQRFIQHYKSLYRMAHYYCHSTKNKNLQFAREILLAATPPNKTYPSMPGLFADRKNTNFFNGIWRAPSNEIDRPGSFGAHMYRSVHLLIQVLTQQKDYNMLVTLTQQLYRTPDLGKKYMRDTDRVFLVREAYDCCVNILRDQMNSLLQEEPPPEESRLICCLLEIYRSCQTLVKAGIYVDETNDLLEEAYTMYRIGEVDSHPSVLEQATKFCQLQLGKSYPQSGYESNRTGSKYNVDVNESNTAMSSVSSYGPDAWQKEFAKSLMMPILPSETRVKAEIKTIQDPLILIPIDGQFSGHLSQSTNQCPVVATQMVHVEKPKAENLQACSVAFLPVTPVFPKEAVSIQNAIPATSLLSCQAFECFDVLTSIMQASGYKVATQSVVPQQVSEATAPINLANPKSDIQKFSCATVSVTPSKNVGRPRKRRRRAATQKMEALNLCKRTISTKPIVSSIIANSIAEIKVGQLSSCKPVICEVTKSPLVSSFNPTICENSSSKTIINTLPIERTDLSKNSISLQGVEVPTEVVSEKTPAAMDLVKNFDDSTHEGENNAEKSDNKENKSLDASDLGMSVFEECAREMLEFVIKNVEEMISNAEPLVDFSTIKMGSSEGITIKMDESECFAESAENPVTVSVKDIECGNEDNSDTLDADIKDEDKTYTAEMKDDSKSLLDLKSFENKFEPVEVENGQNLEIPLLEENELSKDSATEFAVSSPKPPELVEEKEEVPS